MREFYVYELCEAISGRINLYRTILVLHNNYASSTTPTSSHVYICKRYRCLKFETSHYNQRSSTPQIVVLVMALLRFFQSTASLPTAKETRLGNTVTQSANAAILREVQQAKQPRKRKAYTMLTAEQRAAKYLFKGYSLCLDNGTTLLCTVLLNTSPSR